MNKRDFVNAEVQKLHRTLRKNKVPHLLVAMLDNENNAFALKSDDMVQYGAMLETLVESVAKNSDIEVRHILMHILRRLFYIVKDIEATANKATEQN